MILGGILPYPHLDIPCCTYYTVCTEPTTTTSMLSYVCVPHARHTLYHSVLLCYIYAAVKHITSICVHVSTLITDRTSSHTFSRCRTPPPVSSLPSSCSSLPLVLQSVLSLYVLSSQCPVSVALSSHVFLSPSPPFILPQCYRSCLRCIIALVPMSSPDTLSHLPHCVHVT
jgi:hypothetical protein